ncbi:MAG TPA: AMP-binding protein, partial [Flavobacteriales bacterium]|nr:AMP-binding protein [Flavobacteriales bacterium]
MSITFKNTIAVIRFPDQDRSEKPALIHGEVSWSFGTLDQASGQVAKALRAQGIASNSRVMVCMERSPELVAAILGIVRAGACYVPMDPTYPAERVGQMMEDSAPELVIASKDLASLFKGRKVPVTTFGELTARADDGPVPECPATAQDLCYVLFTSGSTGRPKGVAMHHGPLMNLIEWQVRTSVLGEGDRTLQFAPISFDVSFQEIFTTLAQGGTLVLIDDEDRLNSTKLLRTIREKQVDRLIVPFVALQYLAEAVQRTGEVPSSLKEVFTSGEQLRITPAIRDLFRQLPGCRFCNQYGPTEGHVVSELELTGDPDAWPELPNIGKPIDHVKLLVLDER